MARSKLPVQVIAHLCLVLFCGACIVPMILTLSVSLSTASDVASFGYGLMPRHLTFEAYAYIFKDAGTLITGYRNSATIVLFGTSLNLLITSMIAYSLSRSDFRLRGPISVYIFVTMIFSGGMVPLYILIVQYFHWKDMLVALIVPAFASPFHIFLMRVFFQEIPPALIDSAKIDGASDWRTYRSIVLPLTKPALATLALMMTLHYWNETFNAILYIDVPAKYPIQLILKNITAYIEMVRNGGIDPSGNAIDTTNMPTDGIMYAMMVLTSLPVMFLFSFLQKYFVKGMTVGAVKG